MVPAAAQGVAGAGEHEVSQVDPGSVVNPIQGRMLLDAVRSRGARGKRLVAFFALI
ncbi:hypothetical protein GCM10023214_66010 [Amycolatopsis dongchuanensis]|uniref:Uncharacterized protein n=1 Tax=Amycolatopsis dongchuanensis TaxID=1070866 RepID=A0ABP8VI80_9PSEU